MRSLGRWAHAGVVMLLSLLAAQLDRGRPMPARRHLRGHGDRRGCHYILSQASASEADKLAALKYLGHWVGDVHQPLHVSFQDDRGGNAIDEQGPCADNLHAVWDTCIIERRLGRDVRHIAAELRARVTAAERAAWTGTGAKEWGNESFMITTAESVRYCVKTETGCWYEAENEVLDLDEAKKVVTVDEAYLDTHLPIVTRRLAQAGVRLGHLLNRALGGE